MLRVVILSAHIPPENADHPDTYVTGSFREVVRDTRVIQKEQAPVWNETLLWYLDDELLDSESFATVQLREWNIKTKARHFGSANISLAGTVEKPNALITVRNQALRDEELKPTGCTITVRISFSPPEPQIIPGRKHDLGKFICCPVFAKDSTLDDLAASPQQTGVAEVPTPTPKKVLVNKKQLFQVRVAILECRQLQENNIKPVVKVCIGDHVFRTRIKLGNNPYYNEVFVQNFNETPLRLFDQYITIQVLNSKAIRADSLIGVFKIEMGLVYESPGHALLSKWLSLYHPANLNAGLRGYVKVNLVVLGAGDHAPDTDQLVEASDSATSILQLAAMPAARMATLQLYIYQAQDVPHMQQEGVDYFRREDPTGTSVDPSLEANFAGKTLKTNIVLGDANPMWNQLMSFPMQMPSMCDLIKLVILDGEQHGDGNILGTTFISLSQISSTGAEIEGDFSGFLPCFGPSFLTFYGSPKEFMGDDAVPSKFSTAVEEGVAYRGRVLVELSTNMESIPVQIIEDIPEDVVRRVERFLPQRRYGLCVVFYSATMLGDIKEEIQFEVSIGNYGNKFDGTCKPFPSTTQYSHAVYDGNYYYYLPWYDTKPMVAITSFWEDVGHRIECVNTIEFIHTRLRRNLETLKAIRDARNPLVEVAWKKLQKDLVEDCKKPLPGSESQTPATLLDQQMRKLRLRLLQQIGKAAEKTSWKMPLPKLIAKAETWLSRLATVTTETQIGIPDVMIWMLCGERRVAHARVKPQTIMFSRAGLHARGGLCGKTHTIFLKGAQAKGVDSLIPAVLRVRMWFGRMADSAEFMKCCEGKIFVYAETYENQKKTHGIWGTRDLTPYPSFSDVTGRVSLPKDKFQLPAGWKWDGEWAPEPQRRLLLDKEMNHTEVLEEVYENQTRQPGRRWRPAPVPFSNARTSNGWTCILLIFSDLTAHPPHSTFFPFPFKSGAPTPPKEEIVCPQGWIFVEDWKVEVNRAVDDGGWEYGVALPPAEFPHSWNASEKTYHTHRRRRWLRKRARNLVKENQEQQMTSFLQLHSIVKGRDEAWEYAPSTGWRFHLQRNPSDVFRRRCWRRKLEPESPGPAAPIFLLEGSLGVDVEGQEKIRTTAVEKTEEKKEEKKVERRPSQSLLKMNTPLLFCIFKRAPKSDAWVSALSLPLWKVSGSSEATDSTEGQRVETCRTVMLEFAGNHLPVFGHVSSLLDPVAHVSFLHMSQCTRCITGTLSPVWDQTLVFENVMIYGDPRATEEDPPVVGVEIVDYNPSGRSDYFMGMSLCIPTVYLNLDSRQMPRLRRHPITREQKEAGQLLAAFELLMDKKDGSMGKHPPPAWKDGIYTIPKGIRPILRLMAIEILAWGLRDMKNYNLLVINNPSLIIECGGESIHTPTIKNLHENPNFPINIFLMKVYLPVDEDYAPPIELKVIDHREFGYKPVVGHATVRSLKQYYCDPWEGKKAHDLRPQATSKVKRKRELNKYLYKPWSWKKLKEQKQKKLSCVVCTVSWPSLALQEVEEDEEEEVDWWSKYYVTMGDLAKSGNYLEKGFDSVKIYNCELEEVPEFQGFQDFCQTFRLYRGHVKDDDPVVGGEFKGLFRIYPIPEDPSIPPPPRQFQELPDNVCEACLVRVYIIRAFNLQPKDRNGLCDPYIWIKIGKQKVGDREDYIPNTLEPIFGRMYELLCYLPVEKDLKISFYDFDIFPPDDNIGDTTIDLENRLLSRYGANCGLPQTYCVSGPSQWRDQLLPSELLENYARMKNLPRPEIEEDGSRAFFMGRTYQLSTFETKEPSHGYLGPAKERLALHLLRTCGQVPEHIETRTLKNPACPGIDQGKVQMWVDIFPEHLGEPGPPFDITPRKPKSYELRCIIWNTKDVDLEDTNIFGDRMSDIYVKGWLDGLEEDKQKTDIHYRSLTGEGNFNWRFVFTMDYLPMEQVCILTKKQHFWSLDETMQKVPPKLIIQIWDNDKFSADDFLGILELNLTSIPRPAKRPRDCTVKMLLEDSKATPASSFFGHHKPKRVSLFAQKNLRGWWPCIVFEKDKPRVSGKVEMTLELLREAEAEERPAGKGREEPNMNPFLKPPERPETSFLWFTAPLKSLHFIIWQKSKWKLLIFLCCVCVLLLLAAFIYAAPGYLAMKLINPMKDLHFQLPWGKHEKVTPEPLAPEAAPTVPTPELPPPSPKKLAPAHTRPPAHKKKTAAPKKAIPVPKKIPAPKKTKPVPKKAIPVPKKTIPAPKKTIPAPKKTIPAPKKTKPSPKKAIPVPKKTKPSPKKAIPVPKKAIPSPKKAIPVPKKTAAVPKTILAPKKKTAAPKKTIPVPKKTTVPRKKKPAAP
uniref:Fer-1-like protein 5 n=1 Tax=Pogona vitticeps TaxID=103695 RepID=A0ABM5EPS6_9SAUR